MPIDTQSGRTFQSLIVEVAERYGVSDYSGDTNEARIPSDPHDLDKIKRAINRGYQRLQREPWRDKRGHALPPKWSWMRYRAALTLVNAGDGPFNIAGDNARYRLPGFIRTQPLSDWWFADPSLPFARIRRAEPAHVRSLLAGQATTEAGYPCLASVGAVEPGDDGEGIAFEAVFWPRPAGDYPVEADFRVSPPELVRLEDRTLAGADHDEAVLAAAVLVLAEQDADDSLIDRAAALADWQRAHEASVQIDSMTRPANIGRPCPALPAGADDEQPRGIPTRYLYNGVPIP